MTDWIAWTRCPTCGFTTKDVFQKPDDVPTFDATSYVRCPTCASSARYITFPAFDIQTFDVSSPGDAMYDTIDC
jgi:endogenous inhibitor of DNA gyrase (YacG/DUF329 family)